MTVLLLLFQVGFFFLFFSSVALARTLKLMLYKSGENGHVHDLVVHYLRENPFSFSPSSMMLVLGWSYMAFITLKYSSSVPTVYRGFFFFYHKWMLNFIKSFPCLSRKDHIVFMFNWCITLIDLWILKTPCISGVNPT